jgi:hypothetical protein
MPNGYNTVVKSIVYNNYNLFQTLIHEKSPFQKRIPLLFLIACEYNRLEIVKYILQLRPKLHIRADDDRAFRLACSHGHLSVPKFLFEQNNNINTAHVFPNIVCCSHTPTYLIDWLYYTIRGKTSKPVIDALNETCLKMIKNHQYRPIFKTIIYDCVYLLDIKKLLTAACIHNNAECARTLSHKIDNNMRITAVLTALAHKSYAVISVLLRRICNPCDLFEIFIDACGKGDETFLNIMVSHYNYDGIGIEWMFPHIAWAAYFEKQIHIIHRMLEIYPELPFDIMNSVKKYEHYRDLCNYLLCLHPEYLKWLNTEIELPPGENSCSICLCEHDTYVRTNCGHVFGKNCIIQWIEQQHINCPMCRRTMM